MLKVLMTFNDLWLKTKDFFVNHWEKILIGLTILTGVLYCLDLIKRLLNRR